MKRETIQKVESWNIQRSKQDNPAVIPQPQV